LKNTDHEILGIYTNAIGQIVEGEILQLRKSRRINLDENIYYEIIKAKTAAFFSAACAAGASSTFNDNDQIEKMHLFGEKIGIAFQIKDDLFEYSHDNIGKPTNNDILDKKLTLPLIYTLNNCDSSLKRKLKSIIKSKNKSSENINFIVEKVIETGGIQYAEDKMSNFRDDALKILYQFPDSNTRSALEDLVRYTTDRKY
jgi:octaprenyl-diphosphate synthase